MRGTSRCAYLTFGGPTTATIVGGETSETAAPMGKCCCLCSLSNVLLICLSAFLMEYTVKAYVMRTSQEYNYLWIILLSLL